MKIDPEFRDLIPPLSDEERAGLEADIVRDGRATTPLVVWNSPDGFVLLDGHNRYEICCKHKLPHTRTDAPEWVNTRDDAMLWIIDNQANRRNLPLIDQIALKDRKIKILSERAAEKRQATQARPGEKAASAEHVARVSANLRQPSLPNTPPPKPLPAATPIKVNREIAKDTGCGERTVDHARKVLAHGSPEVMKAVRTKDIGISAAAKIVDLPAAQQKSVIESQNPKKVIRALDTISRVKEPERQAKIVDKIVRGEATNVKQAERQLEHEQRASASPKAADASIQIVCSDAVEAIRAMTVRPHVVITDPPYGLDTHNTRRGGQDYADGEDYALRLLDDVCAALVEKLDPSAHIYVFSGYTYAYAFKEVLRKHFEVQDNPIIWLKDNHTMCDFAKWYPSKHEYVWFAKMRGSTRKLTNCIPDVIACNRQRDTSHSAEKPVELLRKLIENSAARGEIVCDPFTGGGASAVAAKAAGMSFYGSEISQEWINVARSRL